MSDRRAEQREQRVAGELLNVAVVADDDVAQPRYHGIDHLEQLFRVEQIGEASESRDVREQRGYQPSLLRQLTACRGDAVGYALGDEGAERVGDVRLRLGGRRARSCGRPAVAAELRAGRVLACTGLAAPGAGRAALAAEAHPFGVRDAAGGAVPGRHRPIFAADATVVDASTRSLNEEGWQSFVSDPEVPAILQEAGHVGRPQAAELVGQYNA